ncbi:hypothetical protein NP493_249g08000 [Ridgeia piscesae]|uniref:Rab-GAP TBC domain-containing protein n=1 Tax=Ridgeia piscesae TaxID=27915 RepID=A0AAD9NYP8_RIDPI|nr:hypothetical protein NP493_249g08000 [Ridgeia piscesae]
MNRTDSQGSTAVMSDISSHSFKDNNKTSFWKKTAKTVPGSIKPVYGAQHPPLHEKPTSGGNSPRKDSKMQQPLQKQRDAFEAFAEKTSDAWDDADDDLILMANVKMSLKDVHSTAMQVMHDHSEQLARREASPGSPKDQHRTYNTDRHHMTVSSTPGHGCGCRPGGPGVGVRLKGQWVGSRSSPSNIIGNGSPNDQLSSKCEKFKTMLESANIDLDDVKTMSWSGIPGQYRPTAWKILSGYLPPSLDRRQPTLERKRQEYYNFVEQYFDTRLQEVHKETFRQIHIDVPRMSPLIALFQQDKVQEIFERILYIWAIRHPASGYVQGINDLVTPFFVVFLTEYITDDAELDMYEVSNLSEAAVRMLEADCFWCFSKLLDGIQDNYTFAQPGIQLKVNALKDLVSRIDNSLHSHLMEHHIEYLQFAFRWMNNLLMREMPLRCIIRLWDTYLAETDGFATFHLYVCASFLTRHSYDLQREKDFQGLMMLIQNLPTHHWTDNEIGLLLAEAYKLKFMFADAPKHLVHKK